MPPRSNVKGLEIRRAQRAQATVVEYAWNDFAARCNGLSLSRNHPKMPVSPPLRLGTEWKTARFFCYGMTDCAVPNFP